VSEYGINWSESSGRSICLRATGRRCGLQRFPGTKECMTNPYCSLEQKLTETEGVGCPAGTSEDQEVAGHCRESETGWKQPR
jgi:hypothetical protein